MSWFAENWIWVALGGGFIAMHLFGHRMGGGCGGHGKNKNAASAEKPDDTSGKEP